MATDPSGEFLVAYDDTDAAKRAVRFALERAARSDETVDVVHIGTDMTTDQLRLAIDELVDDATASRVGRVWAVPGEAGGTDAANVAVPKRLNDLIADSSYELLVMGNETRGLFHDLLEQSVTEALISDRTIPVLLVP